MRHLVRYGFGIVLCGVVLIATIFAQPKSSAAVASNPSDSVSACQPVPGVVTTNEFGETVHTWQIGGNIARQVDPPRGIDRTLATDAQLERWGLQTRPKSTGSVETDAQRPAAWRGIVNGTIVPNEPCTWPDAYSGGASH